MAWCIESPPWPSPLTDTMNISVFGGGWTGNGSTQFPAGTTLSGMVSLLNDLNRLNPYLFSNQGGCLCVETSDPVAAPLPASIKYDFGEGGVVDFAEVDKGGPVDPEKAAFLSECLETLFGCTLDEFAAEICALCPEDAPLTKDEIAAAVLAGIAGPGEPTSDSFTGSILGVVPWSGVFTPGADLSNTDGNTTGASCDPDDNFGWLVVDLGLPATATGTAQTTFTVEDASAGWGTTYVYDKSTQTILAQTYPPGAGGAGNSVPVPFDHTVSFIIPPGSDPTQICLVVNAFGSQGAGDFAGTCDEIGPGETIVTVLPDPCAGARECFEAMFGCTPYEMVAGDAEFQALLASLAEDEGPTDPTTIVKWVSVDAEGNLTSDDPNINFNTVGPGQYTFGLAPYEPVGASFTTLESQDDVQPVISLQPTGLTVSMLNQDNGAADGVPTGGVGFSGSICCRIPEEGFGPVRADIAVVEGELQVTLQNLTNEPQTVDISRDPGRDSTVKLAAGETKVQTYALTEPTAVTVSVGDAVMAEAKVSPVETAPVETAVKRG